MLCLGLLMLHLGLLMPSSRLLRSSSVSHSYILGYLLITHVTPLRNSVLNLERDLYKCRFDSSIYRDVSRIRYTARLLKHYCTAITISYSPLISAKILATIGYRFSSPHRSNHSLGGKVDQKPVSVISYCLPELSNTGFQPESSSSSNPLSLAHS